MRHLIVVALVALVLFPAPAWTGNPSAVAVLTNAGDNSVLVVELGSGAVTPVSVGRVTYGVAVDPRASRAYVTDHHFSDGRVHVIDLSTKQYVGSVRVGPMPHGVAVNRAGDRVYVANVMGRSISVIDPSGVGSSGTALASLELPAVPWGLVLSPDDSRLYASALSRALVVDVDLVRGTSAVVPSEGGMPSGIARSPDGSRLFVTDFSGGTLWVIDTARIGASDAVINRLSLGSPAYAIAVNPAGTRAYVTHTSTGLVSVVDISRPGAEAVIKTVPVGPRPHGVAVSPDGARVFVANFGGHSVSIIDASTNSFVRNVELPENGYPVAFGPFVVGPQTITVQIDVKPGSDSNPINLKSRGTTPVAILGSPSYDVTQVDVSSVRLAGAPVGRKPNGAYMESFDDVNGDGLIDLVLHFETDRMQVGPADTQVTLEGQMSDGSPFSGTDAVRVVP